MTKNINLYVNNNNHVSTFENPPKLISVSKKTDTIEYQYKHFHKYLELFYFVEGEGIFEYDGKQKSIAPHDCLIINPHCEHKKYPSTENGTLTYYVLAITNLQFANLPMDCFSAKKVTRLHFENKNNFLLDYINRIIRELTKKDSDFYPKITAFLNCLLIDLHRLSTSSSVLPTENSLSVPKNIQAIKSYLETNFTDEITLDSLEKMFFVSKSYLLKEFKKQYGVSPLRYLTQLKLEKAKLLLLGSNMSISEIAYSLNYTSSAYFAETFKQFHGITPTDYRKKEWNDDN